MGSEMCIRDRHQFLAHQPHDPAVQRLAVATGIRLVDLSDIPTDDPAHSRYVGLLSGEAGAVVENTLFGEVRLAGAIVFNQVGGVFTGIGDVLAD